MTKEIKNKDYFDEFVFALMQFLDARDTDVKVGEKSLADVWFQKSESLFNEAINDAVKRELESINLSITVTKESKNECHKMDLESI